MSVMISGNNKMYQIVTLLSLNQGFLSLHQYKTLESLANVMA